MRRLLRRTSSRSGVNGPPLEQSAPPSVQPGLGAGVLTVVLQVRQLALGACRTLRVAGVAGPGPFTSCFWSFLCDLLEKFVDVVSVNASPLPSDRSRVPDHRPDQEARRVCGWMRRKRRSCMHKKNFIYTYVLSTKHAGFSIVCFTHRLMMSCDCDSGGEFHTGSVVSCHFKQKFL